MNKYTIKQGADSLWRLHYTKASAQPCYDKGLVFSSKVSWREKWRIQAYLDRLIKWELINDKSG